MSNKPRVYATCPAGCLHETIHREDFLRSAAYIKQIEQAEGYILEQGRTYRLKKRFEGATSWGFPFAIVYSYKYKSDGEVFTHTETVEITLPAPTEFDDYAKIKICGYKWDKVLILVYEFNGTKYEESIAFFSYLDDYGITVYGWAQDAGGCWLVNEDAETVARDGEGIASIEKTATVGLVDTYTVTLTDGTTYTFTVTNGEKGELGVVQVLGTSKTSVVSQATTTAIYNRNAKRITNIEQDVADQFETDASVAYVKDVPENALPYAEIKKVGGMTYKDGDTLKSAKVTEVESVGVNLLDPAWRQSVTIRGVTFTKNADGSVTANGTATGDIIYALAPDTLLRPNTTYYATLGNSFVSDVTKKVFAVGLSNDGKITYPIFGNGGVFTTSADFDYCIIRIRAYAGAVFNNEVYYPLVAVSPVAIPYTPYLHHTLPIPAEVQALDGYGLGVNDSAYNYIDWEKKTFVKRCARYNLADLEWGHNDTKTSWFAVMPVTSTEEYITNYNGEYTMYFNPSVNGFVIDTSDFATIEEAKEYVNGIFVVVAFATPEVTDISDLITEDNFIKVESNGTLTFKNAYEYAVPSEVEYRIRQNLLSQTIGKSEIVAMSQKEVTEAFESVGILTNFLLNDSRVTGFVKNDGTFETANPGWNRTDYIPVNKEFTLTLNQATPLGTTVGYNIAYYDIDKKFVGGVSFGGNGAVNKSYDVPTGVAYVIISTVVAENSEKDCITTFVSTGFSEISERLSILESAVIRPFNLEWENGYTKTDGNVETANADWSNTGYIPLLDVKAVFVSGNFTRLGTSVGITFAFYDINKSLISGITGDSVRYSYDNYKLPVPENASYLKISNTKAERESVVLSGAKIVPTNVATYVVDKNGNGDFETVTEAVANAKTGDIIFVKSGNYENEHIEGFGKCISIIGENPLNTVISCNDSTYDRPALEFSTGVLKNLTIKRNNLDGSGYAFHCEDNYQFNKTLFVENCIFSSPTLNSVGMGMRGGCKIVFKDCQFLNTENQGSVFYLHDANETPYIGEFDIDFVNCYFSNLGNYIMELQSQEKQGSIINIGFIGNKFYGAGSSVIPYIKFTNYAGGVSTNPKDWNGLINWRLKGQSSGNNFTSLNTLPSYNGINS